MAGGRGAAVAGVALIVGCLTGLAAWAFHEFRSDLPTNLGVVTAGALAAT